MVATMADIPHVAFKPILQTIVVPRPDNAYAVLMRDRNTRPQSAKNQFSGQFIGVTTVTVIKPCHGSLSLSRHRLISTS
jgi:hypothetical protein